MVVAYGVGVDYTLFLISRYREELAHGSDRLQAIATTISRVGSAVAASAATGIFGIGMMSFARFGKFHEAGLTISFALLVMLCAALTLTLPLLRIGGNWIFWPQKPHLALNASTSHSSDRRQTWNEHDVKSQPQIGLFDAIWKHAGGWVLNRPLTVWVVTFAVLLPFSIAAVVLYNRLDYGLLTQLPTTAPSVQGIDIIEKHFPAGATGPVTVLIASQHVDFGSADGIDTIDTLEQSLMAEKDQLQIADIRNVAAPLGAAVNAETAAEESTVSRLAHNAAARQKAVRYYVGEWAGPQPLHVTRMDLLLSRDPFDRESIRDLDRIEAAVREKLPKELVGDAEIGLIGPTASVRDLKAVADSDRLLINGLVVAAVFVVLLLLRLGIGVAVYLLFTVIFSYLASLGVTFAVFWALDPQRFHGLDWTVPLFLFTILVAVGIDYNIFLVSRIKEETETNGPVRGVSEALIKTGVIISSCGIIMAGTFSSLAFGGRLVQLTELGFALSFGALLDTFIVRPFLVPSFLILVRSRRLGALGNVIGKTRIPEQPRVGERV